MASKEHIYNSAKKLIKQNGYKSTTIEKIAKEAGVPKGLVTYYFKKEDFLTGIYLELLNRIEIRVKQAYGDNVSVFELHLIRSRILYYIILKNPQNTQIYNEYLPLQPKMEKVHKHVRRTFYKIIDELNIDISHPVFLRLMEAEYGARVYLLSEHLSELDPLQSKNFINFLSTITVRLAGADFNLIQKHIQKSEEMLTHIEFSDIEFIEITDD